MSFKEDNLIQNKTFEFALEIIKFYEICKSQKIYSIKQILRCGTSIGANVEEAIAAQSKKILFLSFLLRIGSRNKYWLRLYESSNLVQFNLDFYLKEIESIINILTKIIKTSSENL